MTNRSNCSQSTNTPRSETSSFSVLSEPPGASNPEPGARRPFHVSIRSTYVPRSNNGALRGAVRVPVMHLHLQSRNAPRAKKVSMNTRFSGGFGGTKSHFRCDVKGARGQRVQMGVCGGASPAKEDSIISRGGSEPLPGNHGVLWVGITRGGVA